jgi:hypothetical protein
MGTSALVTQFQVLWGEKMAAAVNCLLSVLTVKL